MLVILAALWRAQHHAPPPVSSSYRSSGVVQEENHYSPAENLEQFDVAQIDAARQSLDIAMYAFTDRYLAEAVLRAAERGVQVRIYRDREQFDEEERQAGRRGPSIAEMLRGQPNIQLRVKSSRELMHLKAYAVDHRLLRDGSANWSPTGLKRQDNNLRLTHDPAGVADFEREFAEMWSRTNQVIQ